MSALPRTLVLVGPTAVGKTAVALALAARWPDVEVVSADSRQIYRRLDIGTAKATRAERDVVPHHGIDILEPGERYSAGRFSRDAAEWIEGVRARGARPIVVGGTGLYVRALVDGLFREPPMAPERRQALQQLTEQLPTVELMRWAARLDAEFSAGGRQRAQRAIEVALLTGRPLSHWHEAARTAQGVVPFYVRLTAPRAILHQRINRRAEQMVQRGVIEETAAVLAEGHDPAAPGLDGVGIREAVDYLHGRLPRDAVAGAIATASRQYAKRQETWFRNQLGNEVLVLDAVPAPDVLAARIADAWEALA